MTVTKGELVERIADRAGVPQSEAGKVLEATLETIERELENGGEVTITGFGKFSVSQRSARTGKNPATGETIQIPASKAPKFSAGARLKTAVKG
jgi:DNA-binding protein HU-beta